MEMVVAKERFDLDALRRGDPVALDAFYRAHAKQVLGWAIRLGGPRLDPEDVAHEVFAIAFQKVKWFRGDAAPSTWLFVITRNVVANARRRAAFRRLIGLENGMDELPAPLDPQDERLEQRRRRLQVQHALEKLKTAQREVLVLMDLEGRTAPEAAEMLGIPEGTIYSRLHYARKAFKDALARGGVTSWETAGVSELSGGGR
jgi:RNA polymerase sigma-70 factor (ECF subfamily)